MVARAGTDGSRLHKGGFAIFILLVWTLVTGASAGATALPATINANMTLTASGSPYTGSSPTIEPGVTVKVEPGAVLKLSGAFLVRGTLKAEGTAEKPISFIGPKDKERGEWSGIKLEAGSGASILDHVEIRRAGTAITVGSGAHITNSLLHGNWAAVVVSSGASPQITHDLIEDNRGSFKTLEVVTGGAPEIAYNTFIGNGSLGSSYHVLYYATTSSSQAGEINIHDNVFENNQANAVTVSTGSSPVKGTTLGDNLISSNSGRALSTQGSISRGTSGVIPSLATPKI